MASCQKVHLMEKERCTNQQIIQKTATVSHALSGQFSLCCFETKQIFRLKISDKGGGGNCFPSFLAYQLNLFQPRGLRHTFLPRTFYSLATLCIVNFCWKEQFASNWLVTVCSITHFTPQHTLPTGIFFSLEHSAPQPPLLPRTLFF